MTTPDKNQKPTTEKQPPAPSQPAHGFRSVPRALLVERAGKDKAKAMELGEKVVKSMGEDGGSSSGGGGGSRSKPSALERALAEGERDASERMARLSMREEEEQDGDLVAAGIYKQVVLDTMPLMVAKELSKAERKETKRGETTLIYGEISFPAMALILGKIRTEYGKPRTIQVPSNDGGGGDGSSSSSSSSSTGSADAANAFAFAGLMQEPGTEVCVDIGSGAGKPVFAAAALFPFARVVGIEILENLHGAAMEILERWDREARPKLIEHHGGVDTEIVLLQGDFLDVFLFDWPAEADLVVANSTCFDDKLMHKIGEAAARMKQGAMVVTLTRPLPSPFFSVLCCEAMPMSWGEATVYIQMKMTPPATTLSSNES